MARLKTQTFGALLLGLIVTACQPTPPPGIERGAELYETCLPCHGEMGVGNPDIQAPAIAGLPQWYIESQLRGFQAGYRGKHATDLSGLRMRPMAMSLNREGDIESVAQFVAEMPATYPESTLAGNAGAGAERYAAICVACHGVDGRGNELLQAPPVVQLDDWYLLQELRNFKSGARGAAEGDTWGASMAVNALLLPDEQAMADVVAYVQTLR